MALFVYELVFEVAGFALCGYFMPMLFEQFFLIRYDQICPSFFADYLIAAVSCHLKFTVVYGCYYLIGTKDVEADRGIFKKVSESTLAFL